MTGIRDCFDALREELQPTGLFGRIDTERCLQLVDAAERMLPETLAQAARVLAERDCLLSEADRRARAIVASAEERARRMTSDSVILARADEAAQRLETVAAARGESLLAQNRALADEVLDSLLAYLAALADRTRDYRTALGSGQAHARPRGGRR